MALRRYRYRRNGQEFGPVDESVMRTLVASGELGPEDLICSEETKEWTEAADVFVFPKKRTLYQVPPQLAHPPTRYERARPWIYAMIGILLVCAFVLIWAIQHSGRTPVQQVAQSAVVTTPKLKPLTAVDKAIEEMKQLAVPKGYDELVAALESPPNPPASFDKPGELVRWWSAYSQLHERYWNALTQVQQQRVAEEVVSKWREPWRSSRLSVKEVQGEVREVKSTDKIPNVPSGYFFVELSDGPFVHCILYETEDQVARIGKGSTFRAERLRVIKVNEDKLSRLFPEERQMTIWYETD
jgi:hypothetical protein